MPDQPAPTIREALAKLAAQGRPDDIALHLRDQGFLGSILESEVCPVARYLAAATGQEWCVGVDDIVDLARVEEHTLPPDAATFVSRFDKACYPELEHDFKK